MVINLEVSYEAGDLVAPERLLASLDVISSKESE
jgi:hypothetical protein